VTALAIALGWAALLAFVAFAMWMREQKPRPSAPEIAELRAAIKTVSDVLEGSLKELMALTDKVSGLSLAINARSMKRD
jgi:hypothetical protein